MSDEIRKNLWADPPLEMFYPEEDDIQISLRELLMIINSIIGRLNHYVLADLVKTLLDAGYLSASNIGSSVINIYDIKYPLLKAIWFYLCVDCESPITENEFFRGIRYFSNRVSRVEPVGHWQLSSFVPLLEESSSSDCDSDSDNNFDDSETETAFESDCSVYSYFSNDSGYVTGSIESGRSVYGI